MVALEGRNYSSRDCDKGSVIGGSVGRWQTEGGADCEGVGRELMGGKSAGQERKGARMGRDEDEGEVDVGRIATSESGEPPSPGDHA